MKKVYTATNPAEAHMVAGLLEGAGLEAEVRGADLFHTVNGATAVPSMLPAVWIGDEDRLPEALALVEAYRLGGQGDPWTCAACGEVHEAQFSSCWKCGAGQVR